MSVKSSPRQKKSRPKDEMKQEIVAQVHKPTKRDTSSERETYRTEPSEESSESNKIYFLEDKNENYSMHTPSREISVDGEAQINSKILTLIEKEMKRDINKHSHFTDSRPQSLSFYEEEKIPEELSGNLELLSPEERKHYKRRKDHLDVDHGFRRDTDERNAYNTIQDMYSRDGDEIIMNGSAKKSKSRKKRHDAETGLGDSREMMIPKEKRKSKKKRRECSPMSSSSSKKKHRKKGEEEYHREEYETRNDITIALEELQDDVFENTEHDFGNAGHEKVRKSPRKADRVYVQKKNRFEMTTRENICLNKEEKMRKGILDYNPLNFAVWYQKSWMSFSTFCHGLLGGLALAHCAFMNRNYWPTHGEYVKYIANYNSFYSCSFYILTVICLISVFDRYDISQLDSTQLKDLVKTKKRSVVILVYIACMIVHLVTAPVDDKLNLYSLVDSQINVTIEDVQYWNSLSFWRSVLAFIAWIIVAAYPKDDLFYVHLKNMERYIPEG